MCLASAPVNAQSAPVGGANALGTATAAEAAQSTPTDPDGAAREGALEEVTVTAQRRAQNLQATPVTVTALSSADLANQNISNPAAVLNKVPNLTGTTNVAGETGVSIFLRGVGQDEQIPTFDPAVGMYVDGVYIPRQISENSTLYDMARVEVLRGPQGTLYGRNTSGGAIKFIRNKPEGQASGFAAVSGGNYQTYQGSFMANVPINDKIYSRFGGWVVQQEEGFQKNLALNERTFTRNSKGARAQFRFVPTDVWDITVGLEYSKDMPKPIAMSTDPNNLYVVREAVPGQFEDVDHFLANINTTAKLGSATLSSITAYSWVKQQSLVDIDASSSAQYPGYLIPNDARFRSYSEELQVTGDAFASALEYAGGLYFSREENTDNLGDIISIPPQFGGPAVLNFIKLPLANDTKDFAIYGQGTYWATARLGVTVGGRWTHDQRDLSINQYMNLPNGGRVLVYDSQDIRAAGNPTDARVSIFTPKYGLEYKLTEDFMAFASYTEGFRAGGWNARVFAPQDVTEVKDERNKSYELGAKATWLDKRLRTNVAVFRTNYGNFIVTEVTPSGTLLAVNAAQARMQGVELETAASPMRGLTLFADLGFLNAKYISIAASTGIPVNNDLKRAPRWTAQYGFHYVRDVFGGRQIELGTSANYTDALYTNPQNVGISPAVTMIDANVALVAPDERWRLTLSCDNCADIGYPAAALNLPTHTVYYAAAPRTWGVTVRYNFGAR